MDGATRDEILHQAGIPRPDFGSIYPAGDPAACLAAALERLEGLPVEVLDKLALAAVPTPGTAELIQTLKTMGYQVAVASSAMAPVTDKLREYLTLDHCYGVDAPLDEDAMTFAGEPTGRSWLSRIGSASSRRSAPERVLRGRTSR